MSNMVNEIVVSSIWEDEDLFEVCVRGNNGSFSGQADCYTVREEINRLGELLETFPITVKDKFEFSSRAKDDLSFFKIAGMCTDNSGHTLLAITIAHIESFSNARNEDFRVNFDLKVEPQVINNFGKQLRQIAVEDIGKTEAVLRNAI
ncbi:hypothetical protein KUL10_37070 [Glaciecola sp. KUL10]|nr:hypothetical protein KUL10_37070 [Glaciecola sp. KUL10]